jgi:8-amino-7-oxononanoate synthase
MMSAGGHASGEDWIVDELRTIDDAGLTRRAERYPQVGGRIVIDGSEFLNFSSNDYLDLARRPEVVKAAEAALHEYGAGATSSRIVVGTLPIHLELERRLAALKGYPAAVTFGSGYVTNVGVVPALVGRSDHVFVDRLSHASILDATILSRATLHRFRHNDPVHLDELLANAGDGRRLVVTESVFSMDGDLSPLRELADVVARHGAMLMVDEAHATGVFGPTGAGRVKELGLSAETNFSMGTLSKGLGSSGGFVACSQAARDLLLNKARSLIYTTAPPPAAVGAALGALDVLEAEPGLGGELLANAAAFRGMLSAGGLDIGQSCSQVVPVIVGENSAAVLVSQELRERGIIAAAIRPPTVPEGSARLRFSVTLAHSKDDLEQVAGVVAEVVQAFGKGLSEKVCPLAFRNQAFRKGLSENCGA